MTNRDDLCLRMQRLVSRIATLSLAIEQGEHAGDIPLPALEDFVSNLEDVMDELDTDDGEVF